MAPPKAPRAKRRVQKDERQPPQNPFEEARLLTHDVAVHGSDGTVVEVKVGPQGRVVIPAALRERLHITEGTVLVARTEGRHLVFEPRAAIRARLRREFAGMGDISLTEELLEERRREAKREEQPDKSRAPRRQR